ncbi:hypothetical protein Val02_59610 [Virgisporangium aliadipatigenens]|uniref:Histidine kinase domain-containing protein n=1 Tax=Virgisporangium aliadipatigenens TaxID=741659 RepID=A0A8J4DSC4_9ACTN|nr:ATP-binding protein [Virgisporangium aliadipatigenens]GIJ49075.1 hypothetical protein Val02_59610 [Virgisporangium aliadipatigenens]
MREPLRYRHGGVAPAAICRAVLLSRAAVALTAAGVDLVLVAGRWSAANVLVLVAAGTVVELSVLTRWPRVVRRPFPVIVVDLLIVLAVLVMSGGGMAFFTFIVGSSALAGSLLGLRALPLWILYTASGFGVATLVVGEFEPPREVAAFVVAMPIVAMLAGLGAATATYALARYVDLAVEVVAAAQRSAAASERARLARELHDSVAKTLRGVSFAALALPNSLRRSPDLAEQLASTVSQGAEAAAREARQLMQGLRADPLDRDFDATVHLICRSWADETGIRTRVMASAVEPPVALRYELARILQEALHNVSRHARATQVTVRLVREDDMVELSVRDDGLGFAMPDLGTLQGGGHFGIVGMSERARAVGGILQVSSAPRAGTTVVVRVPVRAESPVMPEPSR